MKINVQENIPLIFITTVIVCYLSMVGLFIVSIFTSKPKPIDEICKDLGSSKIKDLPAVCLKYYK